MSRALFASGRFRGYIDVLVRVSTEEQARAIAEELSHAGHAAAEQASRSSDDFWVRGWQLYPFAPHAPVIFGGRIGSTPNISQADEEEDD